MVRVSVLSWKCPDKLYQNYEMSRLFSDRDYALVLDDMISSITVYGMSSVYNH